MKVDKKSLYMLGLNNVGIGERLIQKEQLTVVKLMLAHNDKKSQTQEKTQTNQNVEKIKIYLTKCKLLEKEAEFKFSEDYKTLIEYTGSSLQIKIPPVEIIQASAFYNNKLLESVVIPDSVTEIGDSAFAWCRSLKDVTIPNSVGEIGENAFEFCESLRGIVIPDSIQIINHNMFICCASLRTIDIPSSIKEIGFHAFGSCRLLEKIDIPSSVETVRTRVFDDCKSLKTILLHRRYDNIEDWAIPPSCKVIYK